MCHCRQCQPACSLPPRLSQALNLSHPRLPAGFVFLAFGFNWVDAGSLLGGRLDEDVVRVPAAKVRGAPRCFPLLRPLHWRWCIASISPCLSAWPAPSLLLQVSHSVSVHGGSTAAAEAARRAAREVKRAHTM